MKINFGAKCCFLVVGVIGLLVVVNDFAQNMPVKIPVPQAGKLYTIGYLFDLINTNDPNKLSNFAVPATGTSEANAQPIPDSQCWPANGANLTTEVDAGHSAIGLTPDKLNAKTGLAALRNIQVTLQQDPVLIAALSKKLNPNIPFNQQPPTSGCLIPQAISANGVQIQANASQYQKILLYFLYTNPNNGNTYRLYINDVLPPRYAIYLSPSTRQITVRNPAQLIADRWASQ